MWYVGLDVHAKYCSTVVMDKEGQILARARVASERQALAEFFGRFDQPLHVAMEACYSWGYFHDLLEGLVDQTHVERSESAPLTQQPPRITFNLPWSGPFGSRVGLRP